MQDGSEDGFFRLATDRGVVLRAARVAAIVGTLIGAINYGDRALAGDLALRDLLKIALTYLVPYCVSTWSAVQAIRAMRRSPG